MTIYYLYIKTHENTGLKYLGQTSKKDPFKYKGSGVDWKLHLKNHGSNHHTEILLETTNKEERNWWGRYYSKLYNIINAQDDFGNKIWANKIPETGGGGGSRFGPNPKISEFMKTHHSTMSDIKKKEWIDNISKSKIGKNQPNISLSKLGKKQPIRSKLMKGKQSSWLIGRRNGETYTNNNPNSKYNIIYTWENILTGEIIKMKRHEFQKKFNILPSSVSNLISKLSNSAGGWKIV